MKVIRVLWFLRKLESYLHHLLVLYLNCKFWHQVGRVLLINLITSNFFFVATNAIIVPILRLISKNCCKDRISQKGYGLPIVLYKLIHRWVIWSNRHAGRQNTNVIEFRPKWISCITVLWQILLIFILASKSAWKLYSDAINYQFLRHTIFH